jgi:hypothetical protein
MRIIIAQLVNSFTTFSLFSTSELTEVGTKTDQVSLRKKKEKKKAELGTLMRMIEAQQNIRHRVMFQTEL